MNGTGTASLSSRDLSGEGCLGKVLTGWQICEVELLATLLVKRGDAMLIPLSQEEKLYSVGMTQCLFRVCEMLSPVSIGGSRGCKGQRCSYASGMSRLVASFVINVVEHT